MVFYLLLGDLSATEVAAIMDAHQREIEEALRKQELLRNDQAQKIRSKMAERRRKREAKLRDKHVQEVRREM